MRPSNSGRRRISSALGLALTAAASVLIPASPASAAAAPPALPNPDSYGIDTTNWAPAPNDSSPTTDWRYVDATMKTDAIYRGGSPYPIHVRVLLPPNYQPNKNLHTPYPVLYLLHGGSGTYDDWRSGGDVENLVKNSAFNGIVVMPEAGATGYYTDWWGTADNGTSPQWETFHIQQLLPWIDANFNTTGTRGGRAIAGLSMGGFGALKYAGQHPDKFGAAGSFSGGANMRNLDARTLFSGHMWTGGACIRNPGVFGVGNCWDLATRVNLYENGVLSIDQDKQRDFRVLQVFGPESNFANINPYDMAARYAQYGGKFALYSGGVNSGETGIYAFNLELHNKLNEPGIQASHRWCVGDGGHDWEHWKLDLIDFLAFVYGTPILCHYDN
jgi:S-formylglutathione hydrolase FrmB